MMKNFFASMGILITGNWEALNVVGGRQLISSKDFDKLSSLIQNSTQWDGAALFAFVEGLLRLQRLYPQRVDLPKIVRLRP